MATIEIRDAKARRSVPPTSPTASSASSRTRMPCIRWSAASWQRVAGHAQHQDTSDGSRRRSQAVAPEGHRARASGNHPRPSVDGRWRGLRPASAELRLQGAQQGRQACDAQRPVGQALPRGSMWSMSSGSTSPRPRRRRSSTRWASPTGDGRRGRRRREGDAVVPQSPKARASSLRLRPTPTTSWTTVRSCSRSRHSGGSRRCSRD